MKRIVFETNFNNKLGCDSFLHITFAPVAQVHEHILTQPLLIKVDDNPDMEVEVIAVDLCRMKLKDLRSSHTLPSHGVLCYEFIEWWTLKYPTTTPETDMAVYYFIKSYK